jgi:TetR/AcrR family transcriptional repressor of nem operon
LFTGTAVDASVDSPRVEAAVREFLDALERVVQDGLGVIDDGTELAVALPAAARLVVTTTRGLAVMERAGLEPG